MRHIAYKDDVLKIEYEIDTDGRYWIHCNVYQWSHQLRPFILQKFKEIWVQLGQSELFVAAPIDDIKLQRFMTMFGFTHYKNVWWIDAGGQDSFLSIWRTEEIKYDKHNFKRLKRRTK